MLFCRNLALEQKLFPLEQCFLQFKRNGRGQVVALGVGDFAAVQNRNDLAFGYRIAKALAQVGDGSGDFGRDASDPV